MIPLSFAYSRLVKVKGGSAVVPGTQPVEGDLAESWERQGDTVYVFKLRKGVRWHPKPPVNGRELTAEDVRYTYDRFLNIKGNANRPVLEMVDKVEAVDKHTVKFTLKEPNAWFVERLASTSTWIVAKESVDQHGDLRKPESVVGTGPWMLERYEPNVRISFVRNPNYFVPGLPYADGVHVTLDADPASGFAAFLAGKYDFGPEYGMVVRRSDLDIAKARVKGLGTRDYIVVFGGFIVGQARPGPVQGRPRAAGDGHGPELAGDAGDQRLVSRPGRAQPAHPRRPQGVVDPDRPAPRRGPEALRAPTPRRPGSCSPRPGTRTASRRSSRPRRATARTGWTPCRCRSRTSRARASRST